MAELREQSEVDRQNFRATPATVAELTITRIDPEKDSIASGQIGCAISFRHSPTGRWKIETLTTRDTQDAIQAILAVWDGRLVEIEPSLQNLLGDLVGGR